MKPKNFPMRKAVRQAKAKLRRGETLNTQECEALQCPTDIRMRIGSLLRVDFSGRF